MTAPQQYRKKPVTITWKKQVIALYGDRPPGWPVITDRTPPGLRAVEGRSPWGGYDVAVQDLAAYPAAPC